MVVQHQTAVAALAARLEVLESGSQGSGSTSSSNSSFQNRKRTVGEGAGAGADGGTLTAGGWQSFDALVATASTPLAGSGKDKKKARSENEKLHGRGGINDLDDAMHFPVRLTTNGLTGGSLPKLKDAAEDLWRCRILPDSISSLACWLFLFLILLFYSTGSENFRKSMNSPC